ncbi:MAG: chromate transporter [Gemmatimonadetes bacterium]|nr:chromate transporter [Gemmatimonadota bacterium]
MEQPSSSPAARAVEGVPNESLGALFVRFLRFGLLAWGGPVAQIAMIREQLVDRERWISRERFHRVLAVYQALPGPEAHELCAYFGMLARGRSGAIVAGLGFMLRASRSCCCCRNVRWVDCRWAPVVAGRWRR